MALIPPVATGGTLTTFDYCVKLTLQFFFFPHLPPDCSRSITKWKLADITKLTEFKSTSNEFLNAYETDLAFTDDIDGFLVHINASLLSASDINVPCRKFNPKQKLYWKSSNLHIAHYVMRQTRRTWKLEGSPMDKDNETYINYKNEKRKFKKIHRLTQKFGNGNYLAKLTKLLNRFRNIL